LLDTVLRVYEARDAFAAYAYLIVALQSETAGKVEKCNGIMGIVAEPKLKEK